METDEPTMGEEECEEDRMAGFRMPEWYPDGRANTGLAYIDEFFQKKLEANIRMVQTESAMDEARAALTRRWREARKDFLAQGAEKNKKVRTVGTSPPLNEQEKKEEEVGEEKNYEEERRRQEEEDALLAAALQEEERQAMTPNFKAVGPKKSPEEKARADAEWKVEFERRIHEAKWPPLPGHVGEPLLQKLLPDWQLLKRCRQDQRQVVAYLNSQGRGRLVPRRVIEEYGKEARRDPVLSKQEEKDWGSMYKNYDQWEGVLLELLKENLCSPQTQEEAKAKMSLVQDVARDQQRWAVERLQTLYNEKEAARDGDGVSKLRSWPHRPPTATT